uniref:TLC domain-containing protein 4-A-like n=1 Tax=Styela clava TaxID=7725 RepID=UPI0019398086|nr:TLC domain-containing protein 4-A-like [Styela clava]
MFYYPVESEASIVFKLHHCFSLIGFSIVLNYEILGLFVTIRLTSELSQIFKHTGSLYKESCEKINKTYILNAITFTLSFFFSRVLVQPVFYLEVWKIFGTEEWKRISTLTHVIWLSVGGFLDIVNLYWFTLVMRGFFSIARKMLQNGTIHKKMIKSFLRKTKN